MGHLAEIIIELLFTNENVCICWKFWDYLIEKGINLNHISTRGYEEKEIKRQ